MLKALILLLFRISQFSDIGLNDRKDTHLYNVTLIHIIKQVGILNTIKILKTGPPQKNDNHDCPKM